MAENQGEHLVVTIPLALALANIEAEPDQPMRFLATDCNEFFEQIINTSSVNQQEIISQTFVYRDAFIALTSFLCIFDEPGSSLDYRLRRHESIQDIMIRLLELLRQNLFIVSVYLSNSSSERQQGSGSEATAALAGIRDSLKSLNKIAISIRQSSRSYALTLARNFATSHRNLEDLEELVLTSLETLYPNAPESLREHICNTLTDRPPKQPPGGEAIPSPINDQEPVQQSSIISRSKTVEFDHIQKRTQENSPNFQQKPLSSLDTGLLRQSFNNEKIKSSQSKRTLSVYESDGNLHEPEPPKFEDGEAQVQCEWCYELLDRSVVRNNKWSNIGRLHYKRDLKPFPCVSETCGESRPSFSSRKEWLQHMRSKHSTAWPQSLFGEMMWVCRDHVEDGESISYSFSSKSDLEQHMLLIHRSKKRLFDDEFTKYEQRASLVGTISHPSCPLCLFVVEPKQDSSSKYGEGIPESSTMVQENKKIQKSADSRVSFVDDVKPASDAGPGSGDILGDDSSTLFALELHIAAHLQYLLVMSLRLVATLEYDTDDGSFTDLHGSSETGTRYISSGTFCPEMDAWSEEESALLFISDSERLQLEQKRSSEETAESVRPPYEEVQWNDLDLFADNPSGEDLILRHFSNRQNDVSQLEVYRNSVRALRQELAESHGEHVEDAYRWREIGLLQGRIFDQSRDSDDLDQAVEGLETAAESIPDDDPVKGQNLADLSNRLIDKCKIESHRVDLDYVMEVTEKVVPTNPPQHWDHYINMSYLQRCQYFQTGKQHHLTIAIQLALQAQQWVPDRNQAKHHHHLGELLTLDYWRTGDENTIIRAISELRLALDCATEEDINYSEYLATLSAGLDKKFAMSGSQEELEEAMQLIRRSIDLSDKRNSTYLRRLDSLGVMLGELYDQTGAIDALDESIQIARNVVASKPENDIDAAEYMAHLAARLEDSFQRTGELESLEEAIHLSTIAKDLTPSKHPGFHVYCHSLAARTFELFNRNASMWDARNAFEYSSKAVELLPDTDVNVAMYLCLLADLMLEVNNNIGNTEGDVYYYEEEEGALRLYEHALTHGYSALQSRLQAGRKLFEAAEFPERDVAFEAVKMTIGCLAYLPFADLEHLDKRRILQATQWITSEGVAAVLNENRAPFEVLSLLEDSRCLDANSGIYCLDDFERLRQAHPSRLDEFLAFRKDLRKPIIVPPSGFIGNSPWRAQSKRRYQASVECETIVTEIRNEPGFSNWLGHEDEPRMLEAGAKGAVVVLTSGETGSAAIIIHQDTIEVLRLPDLDYHEVVDESYSDSISTVATLLWLWKTIAKPVLVHLGLSPTTTDNRPRLWLIPTGQLSYLPIHAAGDYTSRPSKGESILDYAICSYIPSIKALNMARGRPVPKLEKARALLVGSGDRPGFRSLPYTSKEISTLNDICQSRGLEVSQPKHKEDVVQALTSCTLFHFAGNFNGGMGDPFDSRLLLSNGSITVKDIVDATPRLHPPYLAYLSSCPTAKTYQDVFADECLHAAGALHMGGFRHTIGTLIVVDDELCSEMSGLFYGAWAEREFSDDTVALCLNEATRQCRDRWIARREGFMTGEGNIHRGIISIEDEYDHKAVEWASFVHFGP
ncbi:hypothetical protein FMUND_13624 [Fusarium mundagurra]|uniref:CHAT domain-containing protein n=1 Tax=Fusarium mundagurra TaxID=1567541 RepID=A0A8H6D2L0_9HYPO|nr:hypothetical protein FMUND_13624 [Fusarium mundagurra]